MTPNKQNRINDEVQQALSGILRRLFHIKAAK